MRTFRYGPGGIILLIVGVLIYFIFKLLKSKIKYPYCPENILSKEKKQNIILIFQIITPIVTSATIYVFLKKISFINNLFINNELFIPAILLILIIAISISLGFLIEKILINSNDEYKKWSSQ